MSTLPPSPESVQAALDRQTSERVNALFELALTFDDSPGQTAMSTEDRADLLGHMLDAYVASRRLGKLALAQTISKWRTAVSVADQCGMSVMAAYHVTTLVLECRSNSLRGNSGPVAGSVEDREAASELLVSLTTRSEEEK